MDVSTDSREQFAINEKEKVIQRPNINPLAE